MAPCLKSSGLGLSAIWCRNSFCAYEVDDACLRQQAQELLSLVYGVAATNATLLGLVRAVLLLAEAIHGYDGFAACQAHYNFGKAL
jgi:hypothetical protein